MTDPANDPAGPYNTDADRQSNTAPEAETVEAPEGLPWEVNPAVERPAGNYETLAEANEAQGITTSSVDDTPTTASPSVAGDRPAEPSTQNAPQGTVTGAQTPADAPIDEAGTPAPTTTSETVGDVSDSPATTATTESRTESRTEYESDS